MRYLLNLLILLHGLIHLMGFAKAFNYAAVSQLTQPISKSAGVLSGVISPAICHCGRVVF